MQWSGSRSASPILLLLAAAVVIIAVATSGSVIAFAAGIFALLLLATYAYVRVEVADARVVARMGPWGWPRISRDLAEVNDAESVHVNPLRYGGWGHRFTFSTTAIVVRGGEGLMLRMRSGRNFLVTVDGSADAARVVNSLLGPS